MDYVQRHWRGELEILQAFWINFVLVRVAFLCTDLVFQRPFTEDIEKVLVLAVGYFIINLLVVYPWQIVGLLRSTERMLNQFGSLVFANWMQFGIVVSLLLNGISLYSVFQPLAVERSEERHWVTLERERAETYSLEVHEGGSRILIRGEFEIGLTRNFRRALEANPDVQEVVLDSEGGYVNQGRAVAKLIEARGLDTRVDRICKSACTIAFMAGRVRRLGPSGRLGFHQYRYVARTPHPLIDLQDEHRRDRAYLVKRGIDPGFAEQAFRAVNTAIWYPDADELVAAGVVHEISQ